MTSRNTKFGYFENLNISKTKQDSDKLKTPLKMTFKIKSRIISSQWHFKYSDLRKV